MRGALGALGLGGARSGALEPIALFAKSAPADVAQGRTARRELSHNGLCVCLQASGVDGDM